MTPATPLDSASARIALREHLTRLREMGFMCLEPPAAADSVAEAPAEPSAPVETPAPPRAPEPAAVAPPPPPSRLAPPAARPTKRPSLMPSSDKEWPFCLFSAPPERTLSLVENPLSQKAFHAPAAAAPPAAAEAKAGDLFAAPAPTPRRLVGPVEPVGPVGQVQSAAAPPPEAPASHDERREALAEIAREVAACQACRLCQSRTNVVPGQGNPLAPIMFVGEGPGENEDRQGLAFVGRAGDLLTDIIKAMQLTRDEVFIANVVKCRPPENRTPSPDEMEACEPFLRRQLAIIRPKVIVALGATALKCLLREPNLAITRIRGGWKTYEGIPLMPTFHPAYLLRNPAGKREVWEDMQKVMRMFGLEPKPKQRGG